KEDELIGHGGRTTHALAALRRLPLPRYFSLPPINRVERAVLGSKERQIAANGGSHSCGTVYWHVPHFLASFQIDDVQSAVAPCQEAAIADDRGSAADLVVNDRLPYQLAGLGVKAIKCGVLRPDQHI